VAPALQFSVLPNHERDWSRVLVALTDITARKKVKAHLEYLLSEIRSVCAGC